MDERSPDISPFEKFFTLPDDQLFARLGEAAPNLKDDSISIIKKALKKHYKNKRQPTYGELRLIDKLISVRKNEPRGAFINEFNTESAALFETYNDLMQKAQAMYGKDGASVLTLDELATVGEDYMNTIGRVSDGVYVSEGKVPSVNTSAVVTLSNSDGSLYQSFGFDKKFCKQAKGKKHFSNVCIALLLPTEDSETAYSDSVDKFIGYVKNAQLIKADADIGSMGIVGLALERTNGVFIDLSKLISSDESAIDALTREFQGRRAVFFEKDCNAALTKLADNESLKFVYFANATSTKSLKTGKKHPSVYDLPFSLLKELFEKRRGVEASTESVSFISTEAATASKVSFGDGVTTIPPLPFLSENKIFVSKTVDGSSNAFASALNAVVNADLELICRGVNRRSICSACSYTLSAELDPLSIGENAAMILGAYRPAIELASPCAFTSVSYAEGKRELMYTAFAPAPKNIPSDKFSTAGSKLYLLPLKTGEDGMTDFASLRKIFDEFFDLYRDGKILSSTVVRGDLGDAVNDMCHTLGATVYDSDDNADRSIVGILFEAANVRKLKAIGEVTSASEN